MEHSHGSQVDRIVAAWGHYGGESLIAAIGASILVGVYPQRGALGLLLAVAIIVLVIGSFLAMRKHDRQLCETCMMHMPLNPSGEAERKRLRFWVAHTGTQPRFFVPYLAVVLGSSLAYDVIGPIAWAMIQSTLIYLVLAQVTHRRLQPWCPWCRNGGDELLDTPESLPSDDRLLLR
jgi:hypothetical protein